MPDSKKLQDLLDVTLALSEDFDCKPLKTELVLKDCVRIN